MKLFIPLFILAILAIGANAFAICRSEGCTRGPVVQWHNGTKSNTTGMKIHIGDDHPDNGTSLNTAETEVQIGNDHPNRTVQGQHLFRIHFGGQSLPTTTAPSVDDAYTDDDATHPFLSIHFGSRHPFFGFPAGNPLSKLDLARIRLPVEEFMTRITEEQVIRLLSLIPDAYPVVDPRSLSTEEAGSLVEGHVRNPYNVVLPEDATSDTDSAVVDGHTIESRYPPLKGGLPKLTMSVPKIFRIKGDIPTAGFKKGVEPPKKWLKDGITIVQKALGGSWWSAIGADTDKQLPKPHEKRDTVMIFCDGVNMTECGPGFGDAMDAKVHESPIGRLVEELSTSYLKQMKEVKSFGPRFINSPKFFETNAAELDFVGLLNRLVEGSHSMEVTAPALQSSFDTWSKMLDWTLKEWKPSADTRVRIVVNSHPDEAPSAPVAVEEPTPVKRSSIMQTGLADQRAYEAMKAQLAGKGWHPAPVEDLYEYKPSTIPEPQRDSYVTEMQRIVKHGDDVSSVQPGSGW